MWGTLISSLCVLLVIITNNPVVSTDDDLLLSIVIFREGDRTPIITLENDPNNDKWTAAERGTVTQVGRKRMYEFGQYLRTRYHKVLVRRRITSRTIYVRSVRYQRNMVTAQLVLNGLISGLTNLETTQIPIHTEEIEKDKIMMTDSCPAYESEFKKCLSEKNPFSSINVQEKAFFENIEKNGKCPCKNVHDLRKCMDPLFCEASEGLNLPSWCNKTCYEHMKMLKDKDLEAEVCTPKLLNLRVQPFMHEIVTRLRTYATGNSHHFHIFMYSGVEDAIPLMLQGVGVTNMQPHIPEFGSSVILELRRVKTKKIISMYYKTSTSVTLKKLSIRGCGTDCEFTQFMSVLPPMLKRSRLSC